MSIRNKLSEVEKYFNNILIYIKIFLSYYYPIRCKRDLKCYPGDQQQ